MAAQAAPLNQINGFEGEHLTAGHGAVRLRMTRARRGPDRAGTTGNIGKPIDRLPRFCVALVQAKLGASPSRPQLPKLRAGASLDRDRSALIS